MVRFKVPQYIHLKKLLGCLGLGDFSELQGSQQALIPASPESLLVEPLGVPVIKYTHKS